MTYIGVPTVTDPNALSKNAMAYLQTNIPGWTPHDGNLTVWMIMALAQMLAVSRDVASVVPDQIFEYFGSTIMNLPPLAAAPATVAATFTARDSAGYDIPAGSQVGFQATGSQLVIFKTAADATIAAGTTTVNLVLTAETAGSAGNGFTGAMVIVDPLAFLTSVTATSTSTGGVDAETAAAYRNRLVSDLQLMAPRPILPGDFAVMAKSITGVYRALGVDGYNAGQTVTDAGTTGTDSHVSSASLNYKHVVVGQPISGTNIPANSYVGSIVVGSYVTLSSSATSNVPVNTTGAGSGLTATLAAMTGQERTVGVSAVDSSGNVVSTTIQAEIISYLEAQRELNFIVTFIQPTVTTVDVAYTAHITSGSDWATVEAAVNAALENYLSNANWGGGGSSPPTWDATATTVRYLQVAAVIEAVQGVDYVSALTLNGSSADVALSGVAPLANYGTITGTQG